LPLAPDVALVQVLGVGSGQRFFLSFSHRAPVSTSQRRTASSSSR
jgi:hypothetical protein